MLFPLAFLPMLPATIAGDSSSLPALPTSGHNVSVGFEVNREDDKEDEAKAVPQE